VVEPEVEEISSALLRFFNENKEKEFSANAAIEKKRFSWELLLSRIDSVIDTSKSNN
jgi:hypothetical protein